MLSEKTAQKISNKEMLDTQDLKNLAASLREGKRLLYLWWDFKRMVKRFLMNIFNVYVLVVYVISRWMVGSVYWLSNASSRKIGSFSPKAARLSSGEILESLDDGIKSIPGMIRCYKPNMTEVDEYKKICEKVDLGESLSSPMSEEERRKRIEHITTMIQIRKNKGESQ